MKKDYVKINHVDIPVYSLNTVIVGTGCAGYNAADTLFSLGQTDIAIVTEGINMGTSRNAGSDKQTYYKLSLEGNAKDSVYDMAQTLFQGGSMHGDLALVESALSARCFFKLVEAGVPFPHNQYGEYVGYRTDHDTSKRATSAGPSTSRFMTESLEKRIKEKGITIFDGFRVIRILTKREYNETRAAGLICINRKDLNSKNHGITLFNCTNIIYATGGPAGMYQASVYPESQIGATGTAFAAGAAGVNLTESQFGIASVQFRWNVSGTYQQVIPRYVSTDRNKKEEREFLDDYFDDKGKMLDTIFLKGYQWPFDARRVHDDGSSLIDILVWQETQVKGRRVFLDFMHNPESATKNGSLDFSLLGPESYQYLEKSDALLKTPVERLAKMNEPAISLYQDNGIDITKEYLEIDVCAQHNNGGLAGNTWYESNVRHLFPVGEVNGAFGVYRPGGCALNSTQVGSVRAAQYIQKHYASEPTDLYLFVDDTQAQIEQVLKQVYQVISNIGNFSNVKKEREKIRQNMTKKGALIRSLEACEEGIAFCKTQLGNLFEETRINTLEEYPEVFINWDSLVSQLVYLYAIKEYIKAGGKSRGSYLVKDENGPSQVPGLIHTFGYSVDNGEMSDRICSITLSTGPEGLSCQGCWDKVRPVPHTHNWFEHVWKDYREDKVIR